MPQTYTLAITFPAITDPADADVVTRRLAVSTDGGAPVVTDYPVTTSGTTRVVVEDSEITLSLTHIDERGNESVPSTVTFIVYDTVPPGQPGPLTYTLTAIPTGPIDPPPGRAVLSAADVTYLGHYDQFGGDSLYGHALTHRYVGGELRFLFLDFAGNASPVKFRLREFTPPAAFGGACAAGQAWADIWGGNYDGAGCHNGIRYDAATGLLWHVGAGDYPQGTLPIDAVAAVSTRTLNSDGTVADFRGFGGFAGVGQRALAHVERVPQWFRSAHATGPHLFGPGGYTSLMGQGLGPSLGPFFLFGPDPTPNTLTPFVSTTPTVAAGAFKVGADCRSGATSGTDWYGSGSPSAFDRGVRAAPVQNYYDGGDPRPNPQTPPTDPPAPGAQWNGVAPDGLTRWVWGDTYRSTLCWVDDDAGTRAKHGILAVATVTTGKAFYMTSALAGDGLGFELHIYDPAHVAEALAGTRQPWAVRPTVMIPLSLPGLGQYSNAEPGNVVGATFDATTNRLYLLGTNAGGVNRVYVFQVGA